MSRSRSRLLYFTLQNVIKHTDLDSGHKIWLTHTNISEEVLLKEVKLTDDEIKLLSDISGKRRRKEFLAVRYLIQQQYGNDEFISYDENGKPGLSFSNKKISISHSGELEAVITHPTLEVGIDLQHYTEKIMRVNQRFLSEEEFKDTKGEIWKTLVYWCAKEALFKYYALGNVDFRKELFVEPFKMDNSGLIKGLIFKGENPIEVDLHFEKYDDYMLVYTLNT